MTRVTTGSPAADKSDNVFVMMNPAQIKQIEAFIALCNDPKLTRPEAVRRLMAIAIAALSGRGLDGVTTN